MTKSSAGSSPGSGRKRRHTIRGLDKEPVASTDRKPGKGAGWKTPGPDAGQGKGSDKTAGKTTGGAGVEAATKAQEPSLSFSLPTAEQARAIRQQLLGWYLKHRRSLPWRRDRPDAYHVLVSETMLQQTQVATVIDYFNRFIAAFPTAEALAAADEQQVLALWQGLGYYRRARGLHAAAKQIVSVHGGRVPDTVKELMALPGVGRYTAGAIASIAHGKAEPIVDGNVARVLARVFAIGQPTDERVVRDFLWTAAAQLVRSEGGESPTPIAKKVSGTLAGTGSDAGDFNQAMMELGALVCLPRGPQCLICPLTSLCKANAMGLAEVLPLRLERRKPTCVTHHVIAIESQGQWLFEQRPSEGLWSNMWQMPTAQEIEGSPVASQETGEEQAEVLTQWAAGHGGLRIMGLTHLGDFTHQTTHRTILFLVWRSRLERQQAVTGRLSPTSSTAPPPRTHWRTLDNLADLPLSNPQKRVVKILAESAR